MASPSSAPERKLGVISLAALVVSAMIGGGIFSLPQNMAQSAALGPIILAWIITGVGIFFLANTFRILAEARPDATAGIYAYARLGFGRFPGFLMAWCYWLCNIFGNVGYAVLLMDALDYFFPGTFAGGNNLASVIGGSLMIWAMNFAVSTGVRQAAFINTVGTICKLVPIILFILILLVSGHWVFFSTDFWGQMTLAADHLKPLGSVLGQVKSTMLVTLWAFIGIEGAVVVSGKAKSQRDVGVATLLGFLGCLAIYFLLSVLPFGRTYQSELARLANPSTAPLLQGVVGEWGGWLMNLGVIIALVTSWLAFTIMIVQIPYAAALDGTFPRVFRRENGQGTPSTALWVSSIVMQFGMIFVYFSSNAWNTMLSITSVMILPPYLTCTAYLWKVCASGNYPARLSVSRRFAGFCGAAGTLYGIWMIYAAGISYLLTAFLFIVAGIPVYLWARRDFLTDHPEEPDRRTFTPHEKLLLGILCAIAVCVIIALASGEIKL